MCLSSCEYFTKKKIDSTQKLDSINYKSVDISPSFSVCDSLYKKSEKEACFRTTIHKEISKSFAAQEIKVKKEINEVIKVVITIHANKSVSLKSIEASQDVYVEIPEIKKIIENSIAVLPAVFPASKRGILVTSEYILPIRIQLKN